VFPSYLPLCDGGASGVSGIQIAASRVSGFPLCRTRRSAPPPHCRGQGESAREWRFEPPVAGRQLTSITVYLVGCLWL